MFCSHGHCDIYHREVLIPGNYDPEKKNLSSDKEAQKHIDAGLTIGTKVSLKKKITIKHGDKVQDRRDIAAGTVGYVEAFHGKKVVLRLTCRWAKC